MKKLLIAITLLVGLSIGYSITVTDKVNQLESQVSTMNRKLNASEQLIQNTNKLNKRQALLIKNYQDVSNIKITTISGVIDAQQELQEEQDKSNTLPEITGGL